MGNKFTCPLLLDAPRIVFEEFIFIEDMEEVGVDDPLNNLTTSFFLVSQTFM